MAWYKTADFLGLLRESVRKDTLKTLNILSNSIRQNSPFRQRVDVLLNLYNTNRTAIFAGLADDSTVANKVTILLLEFIEAIGKESGTFIYLKKVSPIKDVLQEYDKSVVHKYRNADKKKKFASIWLLALWQRIDKRILWVMVTAILVGIFCIVMADEATPDNTSAHQQMRSQQLSSVPSSSVSEIEPWVIHLKDYKTLEKAEAIKNGYGSRNISIIKINENLYRTVIVCDSEEKFKEELSSGNLRKTWPRRKAITLPCRVNKNEKSRYIICN